MTYEASAVELPCSKGNCVRFYVSDGTGIEKYTPLVLSGSAGVVAGVRGAKAASATATTELFCGIAAEEKVASDGQVYISAYTSGIFDMYCGKAVGNGTIVKLSGLFLTDAAAADLLSGAVVGKLLEGSTSGGLANVAIGLY